MDPLRKPNASAKLKTLPREAGEEEGVISQRELIAWMKKRGHTLEKTVKYLADKWRIQTSVGALSEFYSWWHLSLRMERHESTAKNVQDILSKVRPTFTEEQIQELLEEVKHSLGLAGTAPDVICITVEKLEKLLRASQCTLTAEQIEEAGTAVFMSESLNSQDGKTFFAAVDRKQSREFATNKGKLEERKLALAERRVKLLEQKAAQADAVKSDLEQRKATGGLSEETLHMIERTLKMLS